MAAMIAWLATCLHGIFFCTQGSSDVTEKTRAALKSVLEWMAKVAGHCMLPLADWEFQLHVPDIPQQQNGTDCGPFCWKYMECLGRGL